MHHALYCDHSHALVVPALILHLSPHAHNTQPTSTNTTLFSAPAFGKHTDNNTKKQKQKTKPPPWTPSTTPPPWLPSRPRPRAFAFARPTTLASAVRTQPPPSLFSFPPPSPLRFSLPTSVARILSHQLLLLIFATGGAGRSLPLKRVAVKCNLLDFLAEVRGKGRREGMGRGGAGRERKWGGDIARRRFQTLRSKS